MGKGAAAGIPVAPKSFVLALSSYASHCCDSGTDAFCAASMGVIDLLTAIAQRTRSLVQTGEFREQQSQSGTCMDFCYRGDVW
jgi:hypothetical protein